MNPGKDNFAVNCNNSDTTWFSPVNTERRINQSTSHLLVDHLIAAQSQSPILHNYAQAMHALRAEVLSMAMLARQNLEDALRGLYTCDIDLCRAVIAADTTIDEFQGTVDQHITELLLRFHPMASDVRLVLTAMKMSTSLERVSDHAVNIAKRARRIAARGELPEINLIEPLYEQADHLLQAGIASFADRNAALGASLKERNRELDRLHDDVIAVLISRLEDAHGRAEDYLRLILIAHSLERVGNLAVNIGEEAVFLDTASDIRHERGMPEARAAGPLSHGGA